MSCKMGTYMPKRMSKTMITDNLLFGLRVWGYIYLNDMYHRYVARCTVFASKLCSSVLDVLNFRLLKFRPTPGGSLTLLSPPGGFRV